MSSFSCRDAEADPQFFIDKVIVAPYAGRATSSAVC